MSHSYPKAGGTEHYCRPANEVSGGHITLTSSLWRPAGAPAEPAALREAFIELVFQRFLVTFELKLLGCDRRNRVKGYKLYGPHYCNPAVQHRKVAAVPDRQVGNPTNLFFSNFASAPV